MIYIDGKKYGERNDEDTVTFGTNYPNADGDNKIVIGSGNRVLNNTPRYNLISAFTSMILDLTDIGGNALVGGVPFDSSLSGSYLGISSSGQLALMNLKEII